MLPKSCVAVLVVVLEIIQFFLVFHCILISCVDFQLRWLFLAECEFVTRETLQWSDVEN